MRQKLRARILAPLRAAGFRFAKLLEYLFRNGWRPQHALSEAQRRFYAHPTDPAQWHRWYRVNRRRQRQVTALKRLGVDVRGYRDLKRSEVA